MAMDVLRTKSVERSIADTEEGEHQLRKHLGPVQLTVFGVEIGRASCRERVCELV